MFDNFGKFNHVMLKPEGLSHSTTLKGAYMVILKEANGKHRHIPLLIDQAGYDLLKKVMVDGDYSGFNLLNQVTALYAILLMAVAIRPEPGGSPYAELNFLQLQHDFAPMEQRISTSVAEGIAYAIAAEGHIIMEREDFETLYSRQPGEDRVAVPLRAMSADLLQEALKQAVENEWFELASQLRDEIKLRDKAADKKGKAAKKTAAPKRTTKTDGTKAETKKAAAPKTAAKKTTTKKKSAESDSLPPSE